jgi:predicted O-methyltransferase YrrM
MKTLVHTLRYLVRLDYPITQVSSSELALLTRAAVDARTLVEVGTYEGSTTRALAESTNGHVYTIDIFDSGRIGICYPEVIARHHCRRLKNVTILKGASADVGCTFAKPIDFLFIDADHSYEAVKTDWWTGFPKVRPGGIIALHDCKFTERMPNPQGSWDFYQTEIMAMTDVEEFGSVESLVVLRKKCTGGIG